MKISANKDKKILSINGDKGRPFAKAMLENALNKSTKTLYVAKLLDHNGVAHYSAEENEIWRMLLQRQKTLLKDRACAEYLYGLELLELSPDKIPQLFEINKILEPLTSWKLEPVASLIRADEFFEMLANRKFPVVTFIRRREDLKYIDEPDIFHEIVGHCPLLTSGHYADFLQKYGYLGLNATQQMRILLSRLFFFTVETGLIKTANGLKIYGAGILSSQSESLYALDSDIPQRLEFNINAIINRQYGLDAMQKTYYIIEDFNMLYTLLDNIQSFGLDITHRAR